MYRIRPFCREDVDQCIELARTMILESAYSFIPFDEHKMRSTFNYIIFNPDNAFGFVAVDGNRVVGGICGYLIEYPFSYKKFVTDCVLFLHPDERGSMCAAKLVKKFTQWAGEHNAVEARLGITTQVHEQRTGKLYEAMGYHQCGSLYSRRL